MFLVAVFLFVLGLCVGSFVNVLVLRFGFSERAMKRSHCMACDSELVWHDLLPLFSYLWLNGRCRTCGSGLSSQYPSVEVAVGALFALSFILMPPALSFWSIISFASLLFFLASFVGLVAYDIKHTLVPMPFIYALLVSAIMATFSQSLFTSSFRPLVDSALGGISLFVFFMLIVLITRGKGMGAGDAYVAAAIGILLGLVRGVEAVMIGVWAGTLVGLAMLFMASVSKGRNLFGIGKGVTMKTELPLVPYLAFGTFIALYTNFSPLSFIGSLSNFFYAGHS